MSIYLNYFNIYSCINPHDPINFKCPLNILIRVSQDNSRAAIDETAKFLFDASDHAIIDFISRIFSIHIDKATAEITRVSSEYISHPGFSRHLPDIVLAVHDKTGPDPLFHIEIQTEHDGMMDLRMVKYGYLIGASRSQMDEDDTRIISIPHQVVIYLEEHKRIRDELKVKIIFPDESDVDYIVPVFRLYAYSAYELSEMDLYLVIPLVLVKYRKRFDIICRRKNLNQEEFDALVQDVLQDIEQITTITGTYEENGVMDEKTKDIILSATIELYTQLHQKYIRDSKSKERVENMIESVTQKISKKWHMIGIKEGKREGIAEGVKIVAKNLLMIGTADEVILKATGLTPDELDTIKREAL